MTEKPKKTIEQLLAELIELEQMISKAGALELRPLVNRHMHITRAIFFEITKSIRRLELQKSEV